MCMAIKLSHAATEGEGWRRRQEMFAVHDVQLTRRQHDQLSMVSPGLPHPPRGGHSRLSATAASASETN